MDVLLTTAGPCCFPLLGMRLVAMRVLGERVDERWMYGSRFATTTNFTPPNRVRATSSRRSLLQAMGQSSE
jgi:hypothetical protein